MSKEAMKLALEFLFDHQIGGYVIEALEEALVKQEQGEPQPTLYVKDIDGNYHLYKEKGHTENCAALGDDCCPENHLPPSRVGVGEDYSITEPSGYVDHADGQVVWKSKKPANGSLLYTTPQQRKPLTEWQPIETAPTKGRELILLLTPSKWPQVAYTNNWWTSGFSVENKPTHWMPIPPIEAAHGIKE